MKQKRLFGSIASAMLLGLMALTSCVQTDLYDEFYDDMSSESMIARRKFKNDNGGPAQSNAQTFLAAVTQSNEYSESDFTVTTSGSIVSLCTQWTEQHTKTVNNTVYHLECVGLKFSDGTALMYADPQADVIVTSDRTEWICHVPVCWSCPVQPTEVMHTHPGGSETLSDEDEEWLEGQHRRNPKLKLTVIPAN